MNVQNFRYIKILRFLLQVPGPEEFGRIQNDTKRIGVLNVKKIRQLWIEWLFFFYCLGQGLSRGSLEIGEEEELHIGEVERGRSIWK